LKQTLYQMLRPLEGPNNYWGINPESLRSIRRSIPIQAFDKAYDILMDAGAIIKTDIILGLPFETISTYLDCLSFIIDKSKRGGKVARKQSQIHRKQKI
jgi:radical SAM superfamily enzyme